MIYTGKPKILYTKELIAHKGNQKKIPTLIVVNLECFTGESRIVAP